MYNALLTWVKNNLIYTPHCRGESDQEFSDNLRRSLEGYNHTLVVSQRQVAPQESLVTMNVEIKGKYVKTIETIQNDGKREDKAKANVKLTNERGDVTKQTKAVADTRSKLPVAIPKPVNKPSMTKTKSKTELTHKELISQECTQKQTEKLEEWKREQDQQDDNAEVLGIPLPFRSIGERSSLTDLHNLLEQCPQPQPPLINKQLKTLQLNADQAVLMAEQVKKMKTGMERLQEIIKKFNCTEKFKQDIDFIIANVGPAIAKAEQLRRSDQSVCKAGNKKQEDKN